MSGPIRYGASWTPEENKQLLGEFNAGTPLVEIASIHGRTANAIVGKLTDLGRLIYVQRTRAHHEIDPTPFATQAQIDSWFNEEKVLLKSFEEGASLELLLEQKAGREMMLIFRLDQLGYLHKVKGNYMRIKSEPYIEYDRLKELALQK